MPDATVGNLGDPSAPGGGAWDNRARANTIIPGCVYTVYEDPGLSGGCTVINANIADYNGSGLVYNNGDGLDKSISSYEPGARCGGCFNGNGCGGPGGPGGGGPIIFDFRTLSAGGNDYSYVVANASFCNITVDNIKGETSGDFPAVLGNPTSMNVGTAPNDGTIVCTEDGVSGSVSAYAWRDDGNPNFGVSCSPYYISPYPDAARICTGERRGYYDAADNRWTTCINLGSFVPDCEPF